MTNPPVSLLKRADVSARTSLSKAYIYKLIGEGKFPAPVRLAPRRVAWRSDEIDQWIASQTDRAMPKV